MSKYRKKPIVIEATQWHKNGDHPADFGAETEGELVRYYRRPNVSGDLACAYCKDRRSMRSHGWINTLEGGHIVCPGDWIITGVQGEHYPCKPDIFEATYEPVPSARPIALQPSGGFIDGNDCLVVAGDHVEYRFDNHRRGILNEALQNGDAFVTWDDGTYVTVKWRYLVKIV